MGGLLGYLQQRQQQREQTLRTGVRMERRNSLTWTRDKLARGAKAVYDYSRKHSLRSTVPGRHQNRTTPAELTEIEEASEPEGEQTGAGDRTKASKKPRRLAGGGNQERYLPQAWVSEFDS